AVARDHVEADHLEAAVGAQADALQLAAVAVRVAGGAVVGRVPVVVAVVPDEDLVGPAADDLAEARAVGRARLDAGCDRAAGDVVARGLVVARQVQARAGVEAGDLLLAGSHHVERRVRGDPHVLRFVGTHADDGRLLDALGGAVGHVGRRPRADAEVRAGVRGTSVGRVAGVRRATGPVVDRWRRHCRAAVGADVRVAGLLRRLPRVRLRTARAQRYRHPPL